MIYLSNTNRKVTEKYIEFFHKGIKDSLIIPTNEISSKKDIDAICFFGILRGTNLIWEFCKKNKIVLIDLEFEDLHQYIDYPDTWPRADDRMHFSSQWHIWVAEVFEKYEKT